MRFFVGVTDYDWYRFLAGGANLDEVNFWQPSGGVEFKALQPGELFLFKLHSPRNFIAGGAFFAHWSQLPVSLAWEAFGEKNGVRSLGEMRVRLAKYRKGAGDSRTDYTIGCVILEQPFFLPEAAWIPAPADWARNIVRGKGYDAAKGEGRRLWDALQAATSAVTSAVLPASPFEPQPTHERYGQPTLIYPRLGQGSFRVLVTDIYDRRCAVTGERTLPVRAPPIHREKFPGDLCGDSGKAPPDDVLDGPCPCWKPPKSSHTASKDRTTRGMGYSFGATCTRSSTRATSPSRPTSGSRPADVSARSSRTATTTTVLRGRFDRPGIREWLLPASSSNVILVRSSVAKATVQRR